MQVELETHGVVIPRNEGQALVTRLNDSFARVRNRIARMHMSLKDDNGPRGGRDKICLLRAVLTNGREIVVRDRSSNLARAIGRSIRRGRALIAHELKRSRARRHGAPMAGHPERLYPVASAVMREA
jgi:hypothetical protein